jgi:hypothetical protein
MITGYTSYFDASGHPDQQTVLTVGGFVSTVEKWKRFDKEWTAILKRYGVTAFHMTDFVAGWGEFSQFKNNSPLRKVFIDELTACIKKNVNKAFRTSVYIEDYNALDRIFALEEAVGRPYALCGTSCLYANWLWARKKKLPKNCCAISRMETRIRVIFKLGPKKRRFSYHCSFQKKKQLPFKPPISQLGNFVTI